MKLYFNRNGPETNYVDPKNVYKTVELIKSKSLWNIPDGTYVGLSTCNNYTTALGSGQKVLSYTFFKSKWVNGHKQ